jgi:hypothetical protein
MMERNNLKHLSMGEPTYWPSHRNKHLDLLDFSVTKIILQDFAVAKSCTDLSSDNFTVFIMLTAHVLNQKKQPATWDDFRCLINVKLTLNGSLKTEEDTEAAVRFFNNAIQYNRQVGMQCQNMHRHSRHKTALY